MQMKFLTLAFLLAASPIWRLVFNRLKADRSAQSTDFNIIQASPPPHQASEYRLRRFPPRSGWSRLGQAEPISGLAIAPRPHMGDGESPCRCMVAARTL
jgi:hypothetical protein